MADQDSMVYFWFSQKQLDGRRENKTDEDQYDNFVRIDGVAHQFTELTEGDKPSGFWDDYKLVGRARRSDTFERQVGFSLRSRL